MLCFLPKLSLANGRIGGMLDIIATRASLQPQVNLYVELLSALDRHYPGLGLADLSIAVATTASYDESLQADFIAIGEDISKLFHLAENTGHKDLYENPKLLAAVIQARFEVVFQAIDYHRVTPSTFFQFSIFVLDVFPQSRCGLEQFTELCVTRSRIAAKALSIATVVQLREVLNGQADFIETASFLLLLSNSSDKASFDLFYDFASIVRTFMTDEKTHQRITLLQEVLIDLLELRYDNHWQHLNPSGGLSLERETALKRLDRISAIFRDPDLATIATDIITQHYPLFQSIFVALSAGESGFIPFPSPSPIFILLGSMISPNGPLILAKHLNVDGEGADLVRSLLIDPEAIEALPESERTFLRLFESPAGGSASLPFNAAQNVFVAISALETVPEGFWPSAALFIDHLASHHSPTLAAEFLYQWFSQASIRQANQEARAEFWKRVFKFLAQRWQAIELFSEKGDMTFLITGIQNSDEHSWAFLEGVLIFMAADLETYAEASEFNQAVLRVNDLLSEILNDELFIDLEQRISIAAKVSNLLEARPVLINYIDAHYDTVTTYGCETKVL